jgi:hypothetical protein
MEYTYFHWPLHWTPFEWKIFRSQKKVEQKKNRDECYGFCRGDINHSTVMTVGISGQKGE